MKLVHIPVLLLAVITACSVQAAPNALSEAQARHFLVRTGFAPTQLEVDQITGQSAEQVVNALIARARATRPIHAAPDFVSQPPPIPQAFLKSRDEQQAMRQQQLREGFEMKAWWMREMIESPVPLQERMTLFWHNHFASSQQKVVRSQPMWQQQQLFRTQALGNFKTLLHAVAKDPAMLVYLDGANSHKQAPNENFAREVMELFTLGESSQGGSYTEQDIKEAARAFTGWSIERGDFAFRFRPAFHDDGSKTVLGRSGNFDGDGVLDVLLEQPAASRFIVGKLWREFVSPTPDVREVDRIARRFWQSDYDIGAALRELLLCDAFWRESNRGTLIKSPIDLVVGTLRQFGFSYTDTLPFVLKSAQLGQNLLAPPNVKGWPGYTDWINASSLLERKRFIEQLFRAVELKSESRLAPLAMPTQGPPMGADRMRPNERMRAEFVQGQAGSRQALAVLGRGGIMREADGMTQITFNPDQWLSQYGGFIDREPSAELKVRLADILLAVPATQAVAHGTVGVAYLRTLTLDPAYQLK